MPNNDEEFLPDPCWGCPFLSPCKRWCYAPMGHDVDQCPD